MNENVATDLEALARVTGERTATAQESGSRSRTELERRAVRLAGHRTGRGIRRGSRLAIALHNGPEYVETPSRRSEAGMPAFRRTKGSSKRCRRTGDSDSPMAGYGEPVSKKRSRDVIGTRAQVQAWEVG